MASNASLRPAPSAIRLQAARRGGRARPRTLTSISALSAERQPAGLDVEEASTSGSASSCPAQLPARLETALTHLRRPLQRMMLWRAAVQQRLHESGWLRHAATLLAAAAVAPVVPGGGARSMWADLISNYVFVVGFCGWFSAQFAKIFTSRWKTGKWDLRAFIDSGGTPSSHSSLCSSVTTAIALSQGLGSPLFAVAFCFTIIVMYDAMGVRRHAGYQAQALNVVLKQLLEDHPVSERELKEVLGHTPRQVLCGGVLGVIIGLLLPGPF